MVNGKTIERIKGEPVFALLCNVGLMVVVYYLCRVAFFLVNKSYFPDVTVSHFLVLLKGGFQFDISAIIYTNLLYSLMQVLPFRFRLNVLYQTIAKWIFVVVNSFVVIVNCCDIVYFPFTNRRTTGTVLSEFQNEDNLSKIIIQSIFDYWYVALFALLLIFAIYKLYCKPNVGRLRGGQPRIMRSRGGQPQGGQPQGLPLRGHILYYTLQTVLMGVFVYFAIVGMRGGIGPTVRPITISNANKYVNKSTETAIVLNTPFSLIRTWNKVVYKNPEYFKNVVELAKIYSPIHQPTPQGAFKSLNVVVIIIESFGKEYSGFFNKTLDNGTYKGYTPFLDSLYAEGLTFAYSYANGRKSIDAMPSVLSSIPMFVEPFIVTPYSTNDISGIPAVLKEKGYYSAFFHGAPNGSMGFQAYAKSAGFDDYFGLDEYGNKDLDGTWAVWDEEFLQFYADKMGTMKQPFMTSVFTASSHHPFKIPVKYEGKFPEGTQPIHKCVGYTDYALQQFFKKMAHYDWFENTLFVITADHTNQTAHTEYFTDVNLYAVPILFYHHGSDLKGLQTVPVQQMDIMPSILGYLNYEKPYFAFGQDIFNTAATAKFVANYNNPRYQLIKNDYFLQFDGLQTNALYNYQSDPLFYTNLAGKVKEQQDMETLLKAVIQQYMVRMTENKLTLNNE
ncbi:MAG: LTA synthase family protein [Candidatus Symbiothrix sp.]|jgi:arylsulfatase A-like enzyme|nr:LTA synthase family protein [Candidatus Symbiothrix sp.]